MISAGVETFTPKQAQAALDGAAPNRKIRPRKVRRIADDISAGLYVVNGESVIFDDGKDGGAMLDGQHRMAACVLADVAIQSVVVRGIPRKVFATIDGGTSRTNGQVLAIQGRDHAGALAAAARYPWLQDAGLLGNVEAIRLLRPTHAEMIVAVDAHPGLPADIDACAAITGHKSAVLPGLRCIAREANRPMAEAFWSVLADPTREPATHPGYVLRRWLDENKRDGRRLLEIDVLNATILAWNASVEGKTLNRAKLRGFDEIAPMKLPRQGYLARAALARPGTPHQAPRDEGKGAGA